MIKPPNTPDPIYTNTFPMTKAQRVALHDKMTKPHKLYAFIFDTGGEDLAVEADTLAEARASDPSLTGAKLEAVWCITSVNRVWAAEYDEPWKDAENART